LSQTLHIERLVDEQTFGRFNLTGSGLPGYIQAWLIPRYGWPIMFWIGGLAPLLIAGCLMFRLPESVKYLRSRPERRSEMLATLRRMRRDLSIADDAANAASGLLYPTAIRARGVGWALGIGRFGSMLGPLIGGVLIGMKLPPQQLFLLAAAPMVAGLIASIGVARLCYQRLGGLHLDDLPASDTPDALVPDAPDPAGPAS